MGGVWVEGSDSGRGECDDETGNVGALVDARMSGSNCAHQKAQPVTAARIAVMAWVASKACALPVFRKAKPVPIAMDAVVARLHDYQCFPN